MYSCIYMNGDTWRMRLFVIYNTSLLAMRGIVPSRISITLGTICVESKFEQTSIRSFFLIFPQITERYLFYMLITYMYTRTFSKYKRINVFSAWQLVPKNFTLCRHDDTFNSLKLKRKQLCKQRGVENYKTVLLSTISKHKIIKHEVSLKLSFYWP